jgi:hypothetical protein
MNNSDLAKKIREAIFDQSEEEGRVLHASKMDDLIEGILNRERPAAPKFGLTCLGMGAVYISPAQITHTSQPGQLRPINSPKGK